ncbi:AraC family transcriptional regulator [Nannocystis radixulma]|uniref:AraC family transcriptional regulator n=1 Tax=Nannocystis radixulma TaxID=2995305 RepID=A0ABT5BCT8_9BACT|nr:AraC family transcriptional regulator [Nannocystis radixulma]MDC0671957.1 AraC family transcriptional regulator [Nannocystis radixulma]
MTPSTACIKAIRICVLAAARFGLGPDELGRRLEFNPAILADPHVRVPHPLFLRAWEQVPALCGDPTFGLAAAELLRDAPFDVVDYVCAQGPTLRHAIERMLRYQRLHHDDAELVLTTAGGEATLMLRLRGTACAPRHFAEYVVATWMLRARALVGPAMTLRRVAFQHGSPTDIEPHRRLFAAPLAFHAVASGLSFRAELLDAPVRGGDPSLGALLERHADDLLARLPARDDLIHRVKTHVVRALPGELPALEATAKALATSTRTLQRALQAEGTTYQTLVDEVRRDLSLGYLREAQRTVSEIAFLVGFTEVAAFTRAFRRWTGEVPSAWRQRAGQ